MPTYTIRDPQTGKTLTVRGDSPPNEAELGELFASQTQPAPSVNVGRGPAVTAEEPSLARRILTPMADAVFGAGKGVLNTAIGAGQIMHDYVPPVRAASDFVQRAAFGDVQPAGPLFEAARRGVQPKNTAEKVGFGAEQVGEFLALPGGAGKLAVKAGVQALGAGGLSMLQGSSPAAAGVAGGLAAVSPVVGKGLEAIGPVLRESAERSVVKALGPTKEKFKAIAEKIAPRFLKKDVGGMLGASRKAVYEEAKANASAAGREVSKELSKIEGYLFPVQRVNDALEQAKDAYRIRRPLTAQDFANDPTLRSKVLAGGPVDIEVVIDSRPIKQLSALQDILTNLGPDATVGQVVAVRRAWDTVVDQAGGYAQRASGAIGVPLKDQSEAWAKAEGTKAIRAVLDADNRTFAAINKEFAFWADLRKVMRQTQQRTAPQSSGLGRGIMTASGAGAGAMTGDSWAERMGNAALYGAVGNRLQAVLSSPRLKLVSARIKNDLADAIMSGSAGRVNAALSRATAGAVVQGAR